MNIVYDKIHINNEKILCRKKSIAKKKLEKHDLSKVKSPLSVTTVSKVLSGYCDMNSQIHRGFSD